LLIGFALIFLGVVGSFTVPYLLGPPAPEMMGVYMQRTLGNMRPEEAQVQAVVSHIAQLDERYQQWVHNHIDPLLGRERYELLRALSNGRAEELSPVQRQANHC
jgi:hypothetical protein